MKKFLRVLCIVLASVLLLSALTAGILCGALYYATGDAFPPGRYSTKEALELWRSHVKICKEESRDLNDFRTIICMPYDPLLDADAVADLLETGDFTPALVYDEYERTGYPLSMLCSSVAGVKKLNIEGWGDVKVNRVYAIDFAHPFDHSFKIIYDTEKGNIYSFYFDALNEPYYFAEEEFFRFINDNTTLRDKWMEENKPDTDEIIIYGSLCPTLLVDISEYETLKVTLIFE